MMYTVVAAWYFVSLAVTSYKHENRVFFGNLKGGVVHPTFFTVRLLKLNLLTWIVHLRFVLLFTYTERSNFFSTF
jgi:hypothetical protein